jgi:hypothetical protein
VTEEPEGGKSVIIRTVIRILEAVHMVARASLQNVVLENLLSMIYIL